MAPGGRLNPRALLGGRLNPRALLEAWRGYWFHPAPVVNLAVCRILTVGVLLHFRYNFHGRSFGPEPFADLYALPAELYNPLPALHLLIWPIDWRYRPPPEVLELLFWIGLVAGALALIGLLTNLTLGLFTLLSFFLQVHAYSYGNFHHTTAVVLIALGILTLSPCGRVLSMDHLIRWWRGRRRRGRLRPSIGTGRGGGGPGSGAASWLDLRSEYAAWGPKLIGWMLALVYLSAAISKLDGGKGLDWMNGYTLQYYMLLDGLRWDMAMGVWLSQFHGLAVVLSWLTILFEATFALALLGPLWVTMLYLAAGAGLHLGIYVTMAAPFFGFLALYSALVPWPRVLRLDWRGRREPVEIEEIEVGVTTVGGRPSEASR